ncbi:MAG: hypothetical protein RIE73_24445 [Coleofasciculus sp. C1-SOL-03]|uniref:hypothetical protein n=1 Tax=Coleofasciculus sp. C1-SOL-03 TaxID=3069522 RepID=UPI00330491A2
MLRLYIFLLPIAIPIQISPPNDFPTITSSSTANLNENKTLVTTITATDPDGDIPTFAITGGSDRRHRYRHSHRNH